MKNPTAQQVAALFGATAKNVKDQYAKNARQLREMASAAGTGKYRGRTAAEWAALAKSAEEKSR